jgi:hypothetical protein
MAAIEKLLLELPRKIDAGEYPEWEGFVDE